MQLDFHDPLACGTHLLTAVALLPPLIILFRLARSHTTARRRGLLVYAVSAVCLYAASGLFHGVDHGPDRSDWSSYRLWQRLDQTAIFWLIFGSNVPLALYVLRPRRARRIISALGTIACVGSAVLWLFPRPPHLPMILTYVTMGVVSLVPIRGYYRRLGWRGGVRIALLAGFYIVGSVFEAVRWPNPAPDWFTYHEMFHLFDMAGTAAHFDLLLWVVLKNPRGQKPANLIDGPSVLPDTFNGRVELPTLDPRGNRT